MLCTRIIFASFGICFFCVCHSGSFPIVYLFTGLSECCTATAVFSYYIQKKFTINKPPEYEMIWIQPISIQFVKLASLLQFQNGNQNVGGFDKSVST